jgi:hypothetical protein
MDDAVLILDRDPDRRLHKGQRLPLGRLEKIDHLARCGERSKCTDSELYQSGKLPGASTAPQLDRSHMLDQIEDKFLTDFLVPQQTDHATLAGLKAGRLADVRLEGVQ